MVRMMRLRMVRMMRLRMVLRALKQMLHGPPSTTHRIANAFSHSFGRSSYRPLRTADASPYPTRQSGEDSVASRVVRAMMVLTSPCGDAHAVAPVMMLLAVVVMTTTNQAPQEAAATPVMMVTAVVTTVAAAMSPAKVTAVRHVRVVVMRD